MKKVAKGEVKKVLGEDIYNTIKEEILNADVLPGTILDEAQLMSRFGVSRTPIREAIRRLISSDLVGMEPHRSAYVKSLTLDSICEFFEAYQLTQRMVFILSADRISDSEVKKITRVEKQISAACVRQDIRAIRRLNDEFYCMVAAGSSNNFLQDLYIKLREFGSRLSAIIHKSLVSEEWDVHAKTLQRDHDKIISALADKNCDAIGEISDQDVSLFRQKVYLALERRVPDGAPFVLRK